jgi:hypothetical protein
MVADIINGELDPQSRQTVLATSLIGLDKDGGGVRPIAMPEILFKAAAIYALSLCDVPGIFRNSCQFGVGVRGGSERCLQRIQIELENSGPRGTVLAVDIANAFNSCNRAEVLRACFDVPQLRPAWRVLDFSYRAPTALHVFARDGTLADSFSSCEGVRQGDPLAPAAFAVTVHAIFSDSVVGAAKCFAVLDDLSFVGPIEDVVRSFARLRSSLDDIGLRLRADKCQMYSPNVDPAVVATHCANLNVQHKAVGIKILGNLISLDADARRRFLRDAFSEQAEFFRALAHADLPPIPALRIASACGVPRAGYLARTSRHDDALDGAQLFDETLQTVIRDKLDIHPEALDAASSACAPQLEQIAAPFRHGGLGLRRTAFTSPIAFLSNALATVPDLPDTVYSHCLTAPPESLSPWMVAVLDAHGRVLQALGGATDDLPADRAELLQRFREHDAARDLQQRLTAAIEKAKHEARVCRDRPTHGRADAARIRSRSGKGASLFITDNSNDPAARMAGDSAALALKLRLGLRPSADLPSHCRCRKRMTFDHFHNCEPLRQELTDPRHNIVRDALATEARASGATVHVEPGRHHHRRPRLSGLPSDSKPDIRIIGISQTYFVDVSITNPTAPSYVDGAARTPLSAAHEREQKKRSTHSAFMAARRPARFVPFVLESYGAFGKACGELLQFLGRESETRGRCSAPVFIRRARARISAALQRGNAFVALTGREKVMSGRPF